MKSSSVSFQQTTLKMKEFLVSISLICLTSIVTGEQKSPICDATNVTGSCAHFEFYSLYRSAKCCEYEPTVCCYFIPDSLIVTLFIGSGLAVLFLTGWIVSCCCFCCSKSE